MLVLVLLLSSSGIFPPRVPSPIRWYLTPGHNTHITIYWMYPTGPESKQICTSLLVKSSLCPQSLVSPPKSDDPPSRRPVSFCSLLRGTRCAKPIQILHFSPWDKLRFVAVYPEMECNIFAVLADMGACFVSTFLLRSGKPLDT